VDHGVNPQNQGYEYLVMMDASQKEAQNRANTKAYKVLEKDATAHIVKHDKTNMTGFAIFNPAQYKSQGLVKQVDTPVMLMLKEDGHNLDLTVANPDLKLAKWNHNMSLMPAHILQTEAKGEIVTVILDGNWKPAKYLNELLSVEYSDEQTTLKFFTKDGKSLDLPLRKK
jgi:chondroitin-sulfate-ABC endolyase/exolyase